MNPLSSPQTTCTFIRAWPKTFGFRAKSAIAAEPIAMPSAQFSYGAFAKAFPFANNIIIATLKTSAADLVAQCVIERKSIREVDWKRNFVFCLFGAAYLGGFQYFYQVNVFKKVFANAERFTTLPWAAKLKDVQGLKTLAGQIVADLTVMVGVYLPTFYVFKGFVFGKTWSPMDWVHDGLGNYVKNWNKDVFDVLRVWGPTDIVCFSVPMYLRLPVRHVVSFVWTAYLSFMRGGK
jgi:hypothetical protein